MSDRGILIAGIGNIFLGDDGFGCEVAQELARRELPPDVRVVDFGIRGLDLAYALQAGYESAILVDAVPRGQPPGTLYVIEPEVDCDGDAALPVAMQSHGMDVENVLRLVASLGGRAPRTLLVGCEPTPLSDDWDMPRGLSEPARAAAKEAVWLIGRLIEKLRGQPEAMELSAEAV
jgi:hydrogenase maturation protease